MTMLWIDSFDVYGSGAGGSTKMLDGIWAAVVSGQPTATQIRTGLFSFGMENAGANQSIRRVFGADKSIVGVGFALYLNALPGSATSTYLANFLNSGGADICTVTISTTGELQIRTGARTGTVRATSPVALVATAWQHIEIKVSISATVGACEIRVNGVTVLNASNINTDAAAGGVTSNVEIGHSNASAVIMFVDDIFAWDTAGSFNNSFIGDKRVYALYPNADTSVADWVPDTGAVGYSRINETTPVDSSYVQADTVGDVSEYNFDNLGATVSSIAAVQLNPRMLKTDAGVNTVQAAIVSGASSASGAARALTTAATYYFDVFEQDPATSTAWTRTGVNNAIARITRTA